MELLSNMVESYMFEKAKTILKRTTYHGIYHDEGMVVFKGKKSVQEIKDWLLEFQKTVDRAAGNQHFHFTSKIWKNDRDLPPSTKKGFKS